MPRHSCSAAKKAASTCYRLRRAIFPWRKSEAMVDRRFFMDLGVPSDKDTHVHKGRNTLQNVEYVKGICEAVIRIGGGLTKYTT